MKLTENTKVRVKVPKHLYEAIQAELDKKHGMEEAEEVNEYVGMSPDQAQVVEILGSLIAAGGLGAAVKTALQMALDKIKSKKSGGEEEKKDDINEYVGMSPDQAQVVEILGSLIAAGGLGAAVKTALQMALDKIKSKKSDDAEAKEPVAEVEEMEEALDFNTLMEAIKDASKKKAEDKKKKEVEAKKKKVEDEKKKEVEAKKKAAAAKKK
jgi:hypothetical protein